MRAKGFLWKFLLKFARDRQCYLRLVFEAKKRFGFAVLDYMVLPAIMSIF